MTSARARRQAAAERPTTTALMTTTAPTGRGYSVPTSNLIQSYTHTNYILLGEKMYELQSKQGKCSVVSQTQVTLDIESWHLELLIIIDCVS